ncbi:MAG TPA: beta-eliminating lyase-related protein [Stellaceae bacterium]|nr:beta-eliminating lyase-related protein [Stellaceae bacterium]
MNFRSDNVAGIAPAILQAIIAANDGRAPAYGSDALSQALEDRVARIFEHDVAVFPVATGTAANALALASATPPWGAIYCHAESHIAQDECGAPEFYTGGAKLVPIEGAHGKITAAAIAAKLAPTSTVHQAQPAAISLTEASEAGTLYRPAEIAEIAALARARGLVLHMDGARFANAVAALQASPAELTWRAGVDILSLGATKNGALAAEAVIVFDRAKAADLGFRRKRGGHLFSKMRFLSAQLDAYLRDDLWLDNARHANAMAARLAAGLHGMKGVRLCHPVEANEVFVEMPEPVAASLEAQGFGFYRWSEGPRPELRFVAAFDTKPADIDALLEAVRAGPA